MSKISNFATMKNEKVILITGASSGIGLDAAQTLARQGHRVWAAARRVELMEPLKNDGVHVLKMDVTDENSMQQGVETVIQAEGRIDVLVNNAGYGYFGAIENVPMSDARRQLEVNVFGLARLTQLVLPYMRKQGIGRIINTSSIAGMMAFYMGGWYNVTKYSVEAFSDALRMEVKPYVLDEYGLKKPYGAWGRLYLLDPKDRTYISIACILVCIHEISYCIKAALHVSEVVCCSAKL